MSRVDFQNWKDEDDQEDDKEKFEEVKIFLFEVVFVLEGWKDKELFEAVKIGDIFIQLLCRKA